MRLRNAAITFTVVLAGCVSAKERSFSERAPVVTDAQIKSMLRAGLTNPFSVRELRISRPHIVGPDGFGDTWWAVCASYFATNSYGALVRGGTVWRYKDGSVVSVDSNPIYTCENGHPVKWP